MCFYNLTSAFGHQLNFFFGLFYFISFFCFTPSLNCLNNNYRKQVIYLTGRSCCRKEKSRDLKVARFLTSLRHYTLCLKYYTLTMRGERISLNLLTFSTFSIRKIISAFPQNRQSRCVVNSNWPVSHSENIPNTSKQQSTEEYIPPIERSTTFS